MKTSFVADGSRDFLSFAERQLTLSGYQVMCFRSSPELLSALNKEKPSLLIIGEFTPDISGVDVIRQVRKALPQAVIIHVAQTGAHANAVSSVKAGASEFIEKNAATFVRLRTSLDFMEKQKQRSPRSILSDIKKAFIG
jgi:DNA-binding NtrC family response regulator